MTLGFFILALLCTLIASDNPANHKELGSYSSYSQKIRAAADANPPEQQIANGHTNGEQHGSTNNGFHQSSELTLGTPESLPHPESTDHSPSVGDSGPDSMNAMHSAMVAVQYPESIDTLNMTLDKIEVVEATELGLSPNTTSHRLIHHNTSDIPASAFKKRVNYASASCGAKILGANPEADDPSNILVSAEDRYLLNSCHRDKLVSLELF